MNIFKGVAGLLRKGASGAFADLVGEEVHGPGVGSPSFVDIQFRKEGQEELLDDLWQEYQGASNKERTAKAFDTFLLTFIRTFEDWKPPDVPCKDTDSNAGREDDVRTPLYGCDIGHPTKVVVGFVQELKNVTRVITESVTPDEGTGSLKPQMMEAGLNLLHALTIMTRTAHNRKVFAFFDGFQVLMRLMKTAVIRLKALANTVSPDARPSLATYTQLSFLQCLLAHIVSVSANYVDAEMRAIQRGSSQAQLAAADEGGGGIWGEGFFYESGSRDGSRPTSPGRSKGSEPRAGVDSVPLLESGGLNHFVDLLSLLRQLRLKRTFSDNSLEQLTLRTLRSAFTCNPRVQNHFRSIGGLDLLVQNLGWPELGEDDLTNPQGLDSLEQLGDALTLEYRMQLLTLRVLREAVHRNLASLQKVHEAGGFRRVTEMLRWVARTFPEIASPPKSGKEAQSAGGETRTAAAQAVESAQVVGSSKGVDGKVSWTSKDGKLHGVLQSRVSSEDLSALATDVLAWNKEVAEVCKVLCSLLMSADGALGPAASGTGGSSDVSTRQAYWDFALRRLVEVFLDAFRERESDREQDLEALELFKKDSTTLQHYVLYIFRRILTVNPSALEVFRESGTWDVLLSESFFYWGAHGLDKTLEHVAEVASEAQGVSPRPATAASPKGFQEASSKANQQVETQRNAEGTVSEAKSPRSWSGGPRRLSFSPQMGPLASSDLEERGRPSGLPPNEAVASTSGREQLPGDSGPRAPKGAKAAPVLHVLGRGNSAPGPEHVGFTFTSSGDLCSKQPDSPEGEALRLEALSFMETAATLDSAESNRAECKALLQTLQLCAGVPPVAAPLARCLDRILQLAPEKTAGTFVDQGAGGLLAQVMETQKEIQAAAMVRAKGAPKSARTVRRGAGPSGSVEERAQREGLVNIVAETWWQARSAGFSLFGSFLGASLVARSIAAHEGRVVGVLFDLLSEERARPYALRYITLLMKVTPHSDEDRIAKSAVFVRYLETLPRAWAEVRDSDGPDESILHDLLMGIREVVSADPPYYQNLFFEGECFVQIVSLLGGDHPAEVGESLCLEVLATLTKLLAGNDACKAGFRALVGSGYSTLQKVLLERHDKGLTRGLLGALLDMLMDGSYDGDADDVIRNEDVVPLFLSVLREAEPGLQCEGLDSLKKLLEGNVANAACCVRAGLVSEILDWFPSIHHPKARARALLLVQLCGAHSVSGKDMCSFFGLLRSSKNGARPKHSALLLHTLQKMVQKEGPAVFFVLNGQDSGILINGPVRFPSARGYTFTAWLRVEHFPPESSPMGLFNFKTADGRGCAAYLHHEGVNVHVMTGGKSQTVTLCFPFRLRRWHFVAISHNTTRALSGSHAKLMVDGHVVMSEKLRYPKVSDPLDRCSIAASCPLPPYSEDDSARSYDNSDHAAPFSGQLGPVYLFDDALSTAQVAAIHQLGPNYMFSFQNQEVGCVPGGARRDTVDLMDGRDGLASKVLIAYNAQASLGRVVYNNAPQVDQYSDLGTYDGAIMGSTQLCVTRRVQDVIHCVGGIPSLLPLFTQLDQPVISSFDPVSDSEPASPVSPAPSNPTLNPFLTPSSSPQTESSPSASLEFSVDHSLAVEVIGVLTAMLATNPANQDDMLTNQGFAVVGHQLERVSPQHLTVEFVLTFERMLNSIQASPGPVSTALVEDCLTKVYLNPKIWIYTSFTVQRELLTALGRHVDKQPARLRNHCGLSQTLEVLREFYWDKATTPSAVGVRPLLHPVTHEVIGQRPISQELAQLRVLILGITECVLRDVGPSLAEARALVCFLEKSRDTAVVEDALKMIVPCIQKSKPFGSALGEHVAALGGPQLFLPLLVREQEPLRLLGLRLIGLLLAAGVGCGTKEKRERKGARDTVAAVVANIAGGNSSLAQAVQGVGKDTASNNSAVLTAVSESLLASPFTDALREALFEVLVGGSRPKPSPKRASLVPGQSRSFQERMSPKYVSGLIASLGSKASQPVQEDDVIGGSPSTSGAAPVPKIAIPPVVGILLKFVLRCDDFVVRKDVLKEIIKLAEASAWNRDALLSLPDWQERLFDLLADEFLKANGEEGSSELKEAAHEEEVLIRTLFRTLHVHCCVQVKSGWRHLERTVNFLHAFAEKEALPGFYILHDLLSDLLGLLLEIPPTQSALNQQPLRDSVSYILALVDELVLGDLLQVMPVQSDDPSAAPALLSGDYVEVGLGSLLSPTRRMPPGPELESAEPRSPVPSDQPAASSSSQSPIAVSPTIASRRTSFPPVSRAGAEDSSRRSSYDVAALEKATSRRRKWLRGAFANGKNVTRTPSCWALYDQVWKLLETIHGIRRGSGKGSSESRLLPVGSSSPRSPTSGSFSGALGGASFKERARGFVDSLEQKAAELTSGQSVFATSSQTKLSSSLLDRVVKGRGERCPRVVYRLVLLYLNECDLEGASRCMQQFLALLPGLLGPTGGGQSEQSGNRLQFFLWSLLDLRATVGQMDNGARFYVVSQLLRETTEQGKGALASSLDEQNWLSVRNKVAEAVESASSIHSLLQQDRVIAAVKDESSYIASVSAQRSREVAVLQFELAETAASDVRRLLQLEEGRQPALSSAVTSDSSRRAVAQMATEEERDRVARHWTHMYRELTEERGPWATGDGGDEGHVKWKLDRTEDRSRRRLKLKRNYEFDESLQQPPPSTQQKGEKSPTKPESEAVSGGASHVLLKGLRGLVAQTWGKDGDDPPEEEPAEENRGREVEGGEEPGAIDPLAAAEEIERNESMRKRRESGSKAGSSGSNSDDQEVLMSAPCVLVKAQGKVAGRLELTKTAAHFYGEYVVEGSGGTSVFEGLDQGKSGGKDRILESLLSAKPRQAEARKQGGNSEPDKAFREIKKHRAWALKDVKEVHLMRYLLRHSALELSFYTAQRPVFFNFPSNKVAKEVAQALCSLSPIYDARSAGLSVSGTALIDKRRSLELVERARDQWRRREISNFDYLMALNTFAGRTYNDLTQHPVFPWVLSDYTSGKLDLSETASFRDLSKPVGALDEKRLETFEERFRAFSDPDIPSFHYGSHYSTAGVVLFYLLRLEPFTGLHRALQGGKFDHADRLFHSMESAWTNCLTNTSDVKELVPEFFYLPEFLVNANGYYLGEKQDGAQLGDVVLPPWAKGSASEFVRLHREALESEYVSEHLHEWVDLIFGYKQRGKFAVEAANVFYYLTYENAVDLDAIEDPVERASVEDQIANFGQTPVQLFRKQHPKRGPPVPVARPLYYAPASITLTSAVPAVPCTVGHSASTVSHPSALAFTGVVDNKVVLVNRGQTMTCRAWITPHTPQAGSFSFSSMQDPFFGVSSELHVQRRVGAPFSTGLEISPLLFSALKVGDRSLLVTSGHWDNTFKIFSADDGRLVQSILRHKDAVTCVAVSPESGGSTGVVVAGSRDTTVTVWDTVTVLEKGYSGKAVADRPRRVLCGHDDVVNCVAVSQDLDFVVSGSKDASVILHTLRNGRYLRSLAHPSRGSIDRLVLSRHGLLVFYSHDDLMLHVVSLNGTWLGHAEANGRLSCMAVSGSGDFLVTGGERGSIVVRWVHNLEVVRRYEGTGVAITSLHVTQEDCFLVGLQDGSLLIYSVEAQQLKKGAAFFSMVADM